MEISHRFVDIHGIRTHYLSAGGDLAEHGARPLVVLLHGGGIDCAELSWGLLLPELAQEFYVIAPDWPGYGESDRPVMPYSVPFYVEFLAAFLDKLGIDQASFAGLSMGGAIGLGFSLQYPRRVEKLVLVDSYGLQKTAPFHKLSYFMVHTPGMNETSWLLMRSRAMVRYSLQSLLKQPGALTPELLDSVYREANRPNAGLAWNAFQKDEMTWTGARTCFMDRLCEIRAPTLIIHGNKDTLVPVELARQANDLIPGSRLHWMEGCGHWSQRDRPDEFNRVIRDFLIG